MSSAPANHDPALANSSSTNPTTSSTVGPAGSSIPMNGSSGDVPPIQLGALDSNQIMSLLRHLPGVFNKLAEQGNLKEDAAQTLSNLSQATFPAQQHSIGAPPVSLPVQGHYPHPIPAHQQHPAMSDPGPSSHPRGPPNLGQLSAVASASASGVMQSPPLSSARTQVRNEAEEGGSEGEEAGNGSPDNAAQTAPNPPAATGGRTRGGRSATMGSDEWSRQRKDNHKEVERRRRGNINEGINELGRIVPNGSGEKAKGAILSRAVQYIHHLKENEARNIEKWTLEKLLMDQAMGDLQAQLEEMRRLWEEERLGKQRAEAELDVLRGVSRGAVYSGSKSPDGPSGKKRGDSGKEGGNQDKDEEGRDNKRQRVE